MNPFCLFCHLSAQHKMWVSDIIECRFWVNVVGFLKFAGPTFFPLWKSESQGIHGPHVIALPYKPGLESEVFPRPLEYTRRQVVLFRLNKSTWSPANGTVMAPSPQAAWNHDRTLYLPREHRFQIPHELATHLAAWCPSLITKHYKVLYAIM